MEGSSPNPMNRYYLALVLTVCIPLAAVAADQQPRPSNGSGVAEAATVAPAAQPDSPAPDEAAAPAPAADGALPAEGSAAPSAENRRNENVQLTPLDTNVQRDSNQRLGVTATIVNEFASDRSHFGTEYGNDASEALHVSPSIASQVHGRVYESHLNSIFSARSFFQVGGVKPARENEYGVELLAPLWRKASLTVQGSQSKIRGMVNGNVLIPLPGERTPLTTDPEIRPLVERIFSAFPAEAPNRTDIDPRMLNRNSPQRINGNTLGGQFDQAIGERDTITLRHEYSYRTVDAFQFVAGQNPDTTTRSHESRLSWTRQWSPETVLQASFGFDRVGALVVPEPNNIGPSFNIGALDSLGPGADVPTDRADSSFRQAVGMTHSRGRHSLVFGNDLTRRRFNGLQSDSHRGTVRFSSDFGRDAIENLRWGTANRFNFAVGNAHRGYRSWSLAFYAGDRWRVRPNLTLSMGLRYQPSPVPTEANQREMLPYGCDCNNLAPQFGLAWSLPGRLGVLRSAYALQYGAVMPVTYGLIRFSTSEISKLLIMQPDLRTIFDFSRALSSGTLTRQSVYDIDPNISQPYAHQYNFSWEPALSRTWKLQLGYVGSRTLKLPQVWYRNRGRVEATGTTANVDDRRPDDRYSEVRQVISASHAWYDAGKVTWSVPRWRGLSLETSYWFSKAMDLGANFSDTGNIRRQARSQWEFDSNRDLRALTDFDQPHSFVFWMSYDTPRFASHGLWGRLLGNWNFSLAAMVKSGTPFLVETGSDAPGYGNVDGAFGDRPNLLDPSILGRTIGDPDTSRNLLPRSAFAYIRPGERAGNLGRNVFRKGPIRNVNATAGRRFPLFGDKSLFVLAESVNAFNTPQFAEPGARLSETSFGVITNTLNEGRTLRFVASFEF